MKHVVLYNPTQINVFLAHGLCPKKCIITKKDEAPAKMGLLFEATPEFKKMMVRWQNNEFKLEN